MKKYLKVCFNSRCFLTKPDKNSDTYCLPTSEGDMEDFDAGDVFAIEVVEMSDIDFENLPEFDGF